MERTALESAFPNLRHTDYEITSPQTPKYNCIAWAAGRDDRWWWPIGDGFWPIAWRELSMPCFVEAFRHLGYEVCGDGGLEPGYEKVALFSRHGEPKHMARQLSSGQWTSKCGREWDISHALEGLEGDDPYGQVTTILRRPV